jgi:hypothetical protein
VAALLLLASTSALRAGEPSTTTDAKLAAAGWLARQIETDPTVGPGSMADAIFAFAALGVGQSAAATALDALEAGVEAYAFPGGNAAPGAVAKSMLAVQVQGADPSSFGGRDLEAALRGTLTVGGADDGRFGTASAADQALAILALSRTAGGAPTTAVTWLVAAQCPSGEFSWDGSCPAGPGAEDPDTTGLALQALLATGQDSAADAATAWLLSIQQPGGGLPSFGIANTNSSGIGGQALRAAGEPDAADAAAAFVTSLAIGCDGAAADVGAIGWAEGIPGFLLFSTPQAVLALGAPPLNQLSASGALPDAPILECAAAPAPDATPAPPASPPPPADGGALPDTALGGFTDAGSLLIGAGLLAAAAAVTRRRRTT